VAVQNGNGYQFIMVKCNGHSPTDTSARSGVRNGFVTAVAIGKSQRLYSGVKMFIWFYLSSINIYIWLLQRG
jgi:hypothetical protein